MQDTGYVLKSLVVLAGVLPLSHCAREQLLAILVCQSRCGLVPSVSGMRKYQQGVSGPLQTLTCRTLL